MGVENEGGGSELLRGTEKGGKKKCFAKNYKERRARGEAVGKIGDRRRRAGEKRRWRPSLGILIAGR